MNTETYNDWVVVKITKNEYLITCKCGASKKVKKISDLKNGKSKKCLSCSYKDRVGVSNKKVITHGLSDTPTMTSWTEMKRRCFNPSRRGYENYGGRGITVCDRWVDGEKTKNGFQCFVDDMGVRPSIDYQLDRIDNNKDYCKDNCRWSLRSTQDYNKRNTFFVYAFSKKMNLKEAALFSGIPASTIYQRIHTHKLSHEDALLKK